MKIIDQLYALRLCGTSGWSFSRLAFRWSTGNDATGNYFAKLSSSPSPVELSTALILIVVMRHFQTLGGWNLVRKHYSTTYRHPSPTTTTHHHHPSPPTTMTTNQHLPLWPPTNTSHQHHPPLPPTSHHDHQVPPPPTTTTTTQHHPPPTCHRRWRMARKKRWLRTWLLCMQASVVM